MTLGKDLRFQRKWARVAGLMYWIVLFADITGMKIHSPVGHSLLFAGSLFTIPLAFGLYYAVRPQHSLLAASALLCRLLEGALGMVSVSAGYPGVQAHLSSTYFGTTVLHISEWNNSTNFAAFIFTVGSAIVFYLFVTSGYIPRILAWWGLFSSLLALFACVAHLFHPAFPSMTMYAWTPMLLAETSTGLWLLVKFVEPKTPPPSKTSNSSS